MAEGGSEPSKPEEAAAPEAPAPAAADEAAAAAASGAAGGAAAAAGAPAPSERETASRTFFTTIDAEPAAKKKDKRGKFRTLESTNAGPRIGEHHQDLQTLANSLDQRMAALLKEHEKDFFLAYKTHMYSVQKEIKTLRLKADHEEAKTREDTKIKNLEGELDWFMTEALRLDELCKGYKKEVDKWKANAEALDEDRRFLEDQIKGAKRQNKILRSAAERARSSAYSALMATKAKTEAQESGGYPSADRTLALAPIPADQREAGRRPNSASGHGNGEGFRPAVGSGARRAMEARSRTPDAQLALGNSPAPASAMASALALQSGDVGGAGGGAADAGGAGHPLALSMRSPSGVFGGDALDGGVPGGTSLLGNEAERRYVEAIQHLKENIVREQQNVRMLQASRASSYSRKSELEEFFLKCVDEARRELVKRRHMSLNREKNERERVLEAMLTNEDVLVCLYEKLFPHRTGIARSLGASPGVNVEDPTALAHAA